MALLGGLRGPAWEQRYRRKLVITDTVIVLVSVFGAQLVRYGAHATELTIPLSGQRAFEVAYTALSASIVVLWLLALWAGGTRDPKVYGTGPLEYKRVVNATLFTGGTFAIVAYLLKAQIGRGYLLLAIPAGLVLLLVARWLWRKRLHDRRRLQRNVYRTLIVGNRAESAHIAKQLSENRFAGFGLLGAVTELGSDRELLPGLPVVSSYDSLLEAVDRLNIDTLIMTSPDAITPERMRQLSWELESREVNLIVTVALTDIAGPRIHTRPISGLPLIHVEAPQFSGWRQALKRLFDIVSSTILIALLSPVMLAVALAVKFTSPGPVLYAQQRIGLNGKPFHMLKFRSMVQHADDQLKSLLDQQGTSDKPLHKVENDPRITPIGRFIRKYSLDELPQLFNVLLGSMTLVGPRPQREAEVVLYLPHHHRRHLVKPGITGLWQVSGRSDLEWEDAVRFDLYYVENWSLVSDLIILAKTARAVLKPDGAY